MKRDLLERRGRIVELWNDEVRRSECEFLCDQLRARCDHPLVVECPSQLGDPRLCVFCGLVEYSGGFQESEGYSTFDERPKLVVTHETFAELMGMPELDEVWVPANLVKKPTESPRYAQSCDICTFLGSMPSQNGEVPKGVDVVDLYYHAEGSVVARYGPDGDYLSGSDPEIAEPHLREARKRARERGLI